ncbi:MAG: hypothetical protein LBE04_03870, partial [Prevotellaceae bacterium]|nr:hypothetical protein [Prevotellaceae bacterium]
CVPPVTLIRPNKTDTTACINDPFTFEGTYTDNDGTFGNELVSRWEYSATGEADPSSWTTIAGTETSSSSGAITNDYTISSVAQPDAGYYRMAVANAANIDSYNCRAMSEIVHLQVWQCNGAPFPSPDIAWFCTGSMATVNVLKNDIDPDGDNIRLTNAAFVNTTDAMLADLTFNATDSTVSLTIKPGTYIGIDGYVFDIIYNIADDALPAKTAAGTLKITAYPTPGYPDIRVRLCPDAGNVNLSKYIDTTDVINAIQWTSQIPGIINSPEGLISSNAFASSRIHTLTYTVSSRCVSEQKRKVYLEMLKDVPVHLPKNPIMICHKYSEAVNINQLLGIEANGTWTYSPNIDNHVTVSTSTTHNGAVIMNGKAIYNDSGIPLITYQGVNAKIVTFTYTTDSNSCLESKSYNVTIILTENL